LLACRAPFHDDDEIILYFRTGLADGSALHRFAAEVMPRLADTGMAD